MKGFWKESIENLMTVKSIVTMVLTVVFSILALTEEIDGGAFLNIFSVVIAFYFGTQHQKGMTQEKEEKE